MSEFYDNFLNSSYKFMPILVCTQETTNCTVKPFSCLSKQEKKVVQNIISYGLVHHDRKHLQKLLQSMTNRVSPQAWEGVGSKNLGTL